MLAIAVVWRLMGVTPGWYQRAMVDDGAYTGGDPALRDVARELEHRMINAMSAADPDDRVELRVGEREATAWVFRRLGEWLAGRGYAMPLVYGECAIDFRERTMRVGIRAPDEPGSPRAAVLWASLRLEIVEPGTLRVRLLGAGIGGTRLPRGLVLDRLAQADPDVARLLRGGEPLPWPMRLELDGARTLVVRGVRSTADELIVTCRVQRPGE
jgi:hypothetical protein